MSETGSTNINRNVVVKDIKTGKLSRTSIRLEKIEWDAIADICNRYPGTNITDLIEDADRNRTEYSRTARLRASLLAFFMAKTKRLEKTNSI